MNFRLPFFSILALFISGCSLLGINPKYKTPKRAAKYPKFTKADSLQGAYHSLRDNNDVTHYDITLDIDPEERYLKGEVVMSMTALSNIDQLQIDLYENMQVNSISSSAGALSYERDGNAITLTFENSIAAESLFTITVAYEGKPTKAKRPPWNGGFVWDKDEDKDPFVGVACELKGASLWWPLKDHLMDEADSVDLHFTVPETLYCVSNGKLMSERKENGKAIFDWHVSYPINSYNVTVYLAEYVHFSLPYQGLEDYFDLDFYVLPEHLEAAKRQFKQAPIALEAYEAYFGAYPWPRDGYKLIESPYAGMEHQSAIAYGEKFRNAGFGSYDYIIVHETAHEWWGNSITATDFSEAWIHEGFATYSEALVEERYKGEDAYMSYIKVISLFIGNERPVIGPRDVKFWDYHDNDLYMKGAIFLHTLRVALNNDPMFFDILKTFYQNHARGFARTQDLIELVKEKTGEDYDYLFQQYLYSRACPELEFRFTYNSTTGKDELICRWKNVNDDFKMPVYVGSSGKTKTVYPSKEVQVFEMNGSSIQINPRLAYMKLTENEKLARK